LALVGELLADGRWTQESGGLRPSYRNADPGAATALAYATLQVVEKRASPADARQAVLAALTVMCGSVGRPHPRAVRRELKPILRTYSGKAPRYKRSRGLARNLLKVWPALWTFSEKRGVKPTNNHAERGLRGAVIYRKLSLGSQSENGEHRIERLLSASTTCRLQHRSLFEYLDQLLTAHSRGDPIAQLV
jgi:hypothetical protein